MTTPNDRRRIVRMTGVDAGFLYMETPTTHMHTLKIAIVEASSGMTYDRLVAGTLARLDRLPPMRRRIVPIPGALNHPVMITQRKIDPTRHFFHHQVGGGGSMADLEQLIGEIASVPLDRSVPLWEIHLCEGLATGETAVVCKLHHALADGIAANALLANVMDLSSSEIRRAVFTDTEEGQDLPDRGFLMRGAVRDAARQAPSLLGLVRRTVAALFGVVKLRRSSTSKVPMPIKDAPRVSFNGPLTARRSFATVSLPLASLKDVRSAHAADCEATLNDVVLAVISGALRRWLEHQGEHPRASLTAGVPVGLDPRDSDPRLFGNNVSNMFTTLATDIDDPVERLRTIAETTRAAKAISAQLGSSFGDWSQFAMPGPFAAFMRAYTRLRGARLHPAPFSVIASNVPGPRERVKVGGAMFSDVFSVGPLIEGVGLNVTVWSYIDRMNFSLLACPDLLPDVYVLAGFFPAALAELMPGEHHDSRESA
ncbi:diacylglycerol O-acyltransferase [Nocardioides baekrokdamisoli]|uniref:Diacylglycerol O-acyltransferase n=1 Tax=Nocardioides baekrokdamisoli TaxID=1804624 RepID=A0A3G9J354_9ACTN|nr:wax ester/triacylglycerol synthase family O-acyltransferase [Nocardioides baekrokdamisoli]BBH17439.1 diacylglycerol O-acyltransferase [Nocardioides baekrokdamisoli]